MLRHRLFQYEIKLASSHANHFNFEYSTYPGFNGLCLIPIIIITGEKFSNPNFLKLTTKYFLTVSIHFFPNRIQVGETGLCEIVIQF